MQAVNTFAIFVMASLGNYRLEVLFLDSLMSPKIAMVLSLSVMQVLSLTKLWQCKPKLLNAQKETFAGNRL
jgi:hypothetical protein